MSGSRIAALVLAAGRSSRMGGPNKLLATFGGVPLIRRSVDTACASSADAVYVVLGHQAAEMRVALAGLSANLIENDRHAEGMSTSLRIGFARAIDDADGVLVMLADQPALTPAHLDALIAAFRPEGHGSIVVASDNGARGNPAILASAFAREVAAIEGDKGARGIIAAHPELVRTVEIGPAARIDVDTPAALASAGGTLAADALTRRT